jgi:hypothetical protein
MLSFFRFDQQKGYKINKNIHLHGNMQMYGNLQMHGNMQMYELPLVAVGISPKGRGDVRTR